MIVSSGPKLRLHPVSTGVGTGRRGRAETYAEIHLDLLAPTEAAYLWLLFSKEALQKGGTIQELLENSGKYAADLGSRLRDRIYADVIPELAMGVLQARGLKRPKPEQLAETYEMTLVYLFRLLFLAYAEDKGLLPYKGNAMYRDRSLKHGAQDLTELKRSNASFGEDTIWWNEIELLFKAVDKGNKNWGVPAYNGGLFSRDASVSQVGARLAEISLPDSVLGPVLTSLLVEGTPEGWGPVDFRSLGVREFGTIYEGLLENELALADIDLTVKKEQYAPVGARDNIIVRKGHALSKALDEHWERLDTLSNDAEAAAAFFDLRVADIAMGSGHFLVSAVDHIERSLSNYLVHRPLKAVHDELTRLREAAVDALGALGNSVTIEDTQLLRRQIARRCIYGVDLNPMAVELARLAIWIHTFVPGLPLSFLDHNLVQGNALVGIGTLKEANEWMSEIAGSLFQLSSQELEPAVEALRLLAELSDANAAEIAQARRAFTKAKSAAAPVAALFDILAAARLDDDCSHAAHEDSARWLRDLSRLIDSPIHRRAKRVLSAVPAFHFPVAFPEVFLRKRSGFDVILGNPPWEEATVEEDRFWTRHQPGFHSLRQREQEEVKEQLRQSRPDLVKIYEQEKTEAELIRAILTSDQYPGMGTGDPDVYKAFYWRFWELLAPNTGWAGIVLPRSAMCAKGSTEFRKIAFSEGQFSDLTWLLNSGGWVFDDVHPQWTIVLSAFSKRPAREDQTMPLRGPYRSLARFETGVKGSPLRFRVSDVMSWTDTSALPLLPTEDSGEVFLQIRRSPRLDAGTDGSWKARPQREFDATNDRPLMVFADDPPDDFWPIFKGESFDIWEPDTGRYYAWGDPEILKQALYDKRIRSARLERSAFYGFTETWLRDPETLACLRPRIVFRDVTRATDSRTVRAALVPGKAFLTNKAPYLTWPIGDAKDQAFLLGTLCSIPLDWYARRFVEINLNFFVLNPFPIPRPPRESALWQRVVSLAGRLASPDIRFADWAKAVGVAHGKLLPDEKQEMITELDAVVALLYGLNERQLRIVFETFHEGWNYEDRLRATLKHFDSWKARA